MIQKKATKTFDHHLDGLIYSEGDGRDVGFDGRGTFSSFGSG